jgi:hypothetical protein
LTELGLGDEEYVAVVAEPGADRVLQLDALVPGRGPDHGQIDVAVEVWFAAGDRPEADHRLHRRDDHLLEGSCGCVRHGADGIRAILGAWDERGCR